MWLLSKIEISDYTLQKADVGFAYCSKYFEGEPPNHWKIRHSLCIPWFGLDFEEKLSILKLLHVGFVEKKMVPNVVKRTKAMCKHVFIVQKRNSRLDTAVSRCGICLLQCIFQRGTTKPLEN